MTFIQRLFQARDVKHYRNTTAVKDNEQRRNQNGVSLRKQGVGRGSGEFGEHAKCKNTFTENFHLSLSSSLHPFYYNEIISSSTPLIFIFIFLLFVYLKLTVIATKMFSFVGLKTQYFLSQA